MSNSGYYYVLDLSDAKIVLGTDSLEAARESADSEGSRIVSERVR